ncbi:lipoprotein [Nitrosomonas sp. PY1]|uniref:lipid-binding SYLF domain-containing protein n=1 Tax=Nitrosomonas sp. PY1 TaxID=1803906 RepID=UPI001FC8802A|nr:lipid-binding SYLF domain-containing protein [Nitrosomonas sp. PY1]GKS69258.1 lipoprotein [Nitrosomonas sp. PY1]
MIKINIVWITMVLFVLLSACQSTSDNQSTSTSTSTSTTQKPAQEKSVEAIQIDQEATTALNKLYATDSSAKILGQKAVGILVFPSILKAGFIAGAQYGKGALLQGGKTVGYYNSIAASYGLQAGVQQFGYVLFFMNTDALSYIDNSSGWEIGVGPSLVVVDEGFGKVLSSTTLKDDIYAIVFDQKGLMAGLGIQGTKITKIDP